MGVINAERRNDSEAVLDEAKKSQDDAESIKERHITKKLESAKTQADQIILDARGKSTRLSRRQALERDQTGSRQ